MHWVDKFIQYTDGMNSPVLFRKWAAITTISGALERRVWMTIPALGKCYPNIFVLLVAPPGVGKSSILRKVKDLWESTNRLYTAPDNLSKASFLDAMARTTNDKRTWNGQRIEQSPMQVCSSEFGNFVPAYDTQFLNVLNDFWDCRNRFVDEKRVKSVEIPYPQLTMLAGTQPAFLNTLLPEEAFGMGFMSRMLMIYVNNPSKINLWSTPYSEENEKELQEDVYGFTELCGPCELSDPAKHALSDWYENGCTPVPSHTKLTDYNVRRFHNVQKLMIISAVARTNTLIADAADFHIALEWLLEAERKMPDIFRAMKGRSDDEVLQEMHRWATAEFAKTTKSIHEAKIIAFFRPRVPNEKILGLIDTACRSGMIVLTGEKMYQPKPKVHWDVED